MGQLHSSVVLVALVLAGVGRAQDGGRTVADGVYTDAQAERGAISYNAACGGCHRPDLGGATGPSLKQQRFATNYAGKGLDALYMKIATTMPRNAAGTLSEDVTLYIVAYILKENGFAGGPAELTVDALPAVKVLPGKPKPPPPVGAFSYVETVGCLTPGPDGSWLLTIATAPKSVVLPVSSERGASAATAASGGTHTFHLLDAMAYSPETHRGHTMYVRGLLVQLPVEQRLTISAFEMVSPGCAR